MKVKLVSASIFRMLLLGWFILFVANCGAYFVKAGVGLGDHYYTQLFDLNSESNIPTLYSSVLLLLASLASAYTGAIHRKLNSRITRIWYLLAAGFLFMGVDESVRIHEAINGIIRDHIQLSGFFFFIWVIPFGILALGLGIFFWFRFLPALPVSTRHLLLLSGVIYLSGALVLEMIGGEVFSSEGSDFAFFVSYTVEESFELLGISLYIYTIARYLQSEFRVKLKFRNLVAVSDAKTQNAPSSN